MIQTLIHNKHFGGKYVALKDFSSHTVICEGATPEEVYNKALEKGCKDPVITFVPVRNMVQIY